MSTPLNYDCACCLAAAAQPSAVDATLIILCMCTYDVCTIDSIVKDLCFEHRRRLHEAGRKQDEELR